MSKVKSLIAVLTDIPVFETLNAQLKEFPVRLLPKPADVSAFDGSENEYSKEWLSELNSAEIVIADPPNLGLFKNHLSSLRWCQSTFAGPDATVRTIRNTPSLLKKVQDDELLITRVGSQLSVPMSEYVVSMIIRNERRFDDLLVAQNEKSWTNNEYNQEGYRTIKELKFCILGIGDIGCAIANSLKFGFGAQNIIGLSKTSKSEDPNYQNLFNKCYIFEEMGRIIAENPDIDYIINCLPSTRATKHLLNEKRLKDCKNQPYFINVGRGDVIDTDELIKCLDNGVIGGACLDVFENEPLDESNALWQKENVIITPHISALTFPNDVTNVFMHNLTRYQNGEQLEYLVNIETGY